MSVEERRSWVGENVAHVRHGHGWSQIELADRLTQALGKRFDPATLARLEKGKRSIDVGELVVLAEVLQTEPMALLGHPQRLRWRRDIDEARRESRDALRVLSESAARYFTYRGIEERLTTEAAERGEKVSGVTLWPDQPAAFERWSTSSQRPVCRSRSLGRSRPQPVSRSLGSLFLGWKFRLPMSVSNRDHPEVVGGRFCPDNYPISAGQRLTSVAIVAVGGGLT